LIGLKPENSSSKVSTMFHDGTTEMFDNNAIPTLKFKRTRKILRSAVGLVRYIPLNPPEFLTVNTSKAIALTIQKQVYDTE
jgi:hypothetical protein